MRLYMPDVSRWDGRGGWNWFTQRRKDAKGPARSSAKKSIPIRFDGLIIEEGFRADLLVKGALAIELKCTERFAPVHAKQLLTYLRLMNLPLGLLMNFGAASFREGIKRVVNGIGPFAPSRLCVR
jgi:GxxExxY protein